MLFRKLQNYLAAWPPDSINYGKRDGEAAGIGVQSTGEASLTANRAAKPRLSLLFDQSPH